MTGAGKNTSIQFLHRLAPGLGDLLPKEAACQPLLFRVVGSGCRASSGCDPPTLLRGSGCGHTVPCGAARLLRLPCAAGLLSLPRQQLLASAWSSALASSAPRPSRPCLIAFQPAPLCSVPCRPLCRSWISSECLQCVLIIFPVLPCPPF